MFDYKNPSITGKKDLDQKRFRIFKRQNASYHRYQWYPWYFASGGLVCAFFRFLPSRHQNPRNFQPQKSEPQKTEANATELLWVCFVEGQCFAPVVEKSIIHILIKRIIKWHKLRAVTRRATKVGLQVRVIFIQSKQRMDPALLQIRT